MLRIPTCHSASPAVVCEGAAKGWWPGRPLSSEPVGRAPISHGIKTAVSSEVAVGVFARQQQRSITGAALGSAKCTRSSHLSPERGCCAAHHAEAAASSSGMRDAYEGRPLALRPSARFSSCGSGMRCVARCRSGEVAPSLWGCGCEPCCRSEPSSAGVGTGMKRHPRPQGARPLKARPGRFALPRRPPA
jgi:hypothetical protein